MRGLNRPPPVVFVGPSLPGSEVRRLLPEALVRPPIRRGDLHDQPVGPGSVFVILDGVPSAKDSITGREILDVIGNHALVVGASGVGARLAGECWPGGMQGVGIVYRMFRSGSSSADDELSVSLDPAAPGRSSVSLLNVRYATSKLRRRGRIDQAMRDRIVAAAESLAIGERRWNLILASAGVTDGAAELAAALAEYDLGATDARRALLHVARQLGLRSPGPGLAAGRPPPAEQRGHGLREEDLRQDLLDWLFISGRFHRYLDGVRAATPASRPLSGEKPMTGAGDELWAELMARGELERELIQRRTLRTAITEAQASGEIATRVHRYEAEQAIALEHLCIDWHELETNTSADPVLWSRLCAYRDQLALACALRDRRSPPDRSC